MLLPLLLLLLLLLLCGGGCCSVLFGRLLNATQCCWVEHTDSSQKHQGGRAC
jgi:hypothetical protein